MAVVDASLASVVDSAVNNSVSFIASAEIERE